MKTGAFRQLGERRQPPWMGPAGDHLLPLVPSGSQWPRSGSRRPPGRFRLRDPIRSEADHTDPVRGQLDGERTGERLLGCLRRTVAPCRGKPVREEIAVTVMITPDPFGIMDRAASRAVRKYEVTSDVSGGANRSTSTSTSGTPRICAFGTSTALRRCRGGSLYRSPSGDGHQQPARRGNRPPPPRRTRRRPRSPHDTDGEDVRVAARHHVRSNARTSTS